LEGQGSSAEVVWQFKGPTVELWVLVGHR